MHSESALPRLQIQVETPTGPQEVRPGCWMVGRRNPRSLLQCNTYLRTFEGGQSPLHLCVDPGSQYDFPDVEKNINRLIGDVGEIRSLSLNHQDPDVIGNAQYLIAANPNVSILATEEVWRLAQHMLYQPRRVHFVNAERSSLITLGDWRRWQLVPTPFCHFRGAMAFYDPELRVLFSGDLFGGLNLMGRVHVWAEESDWWGIAQFHQIYMPLREALRHAVRQIRALDPPVEIIAPQHGHLIGGDLVPLFLERMHELLVGFDLLSVEWDEAKRTGYAEVVAQVLDFASALMGRDEALARLKSLDPADGLEQLLAVRGDDVQLLREGYSAVAKVFARLSHRESQEVANALRSIVLQTCAERKLPIPPVGAGVEEAAAPPSVGPDGIRTQAWWLT